MLLLLLFNSNNVTNCENCMVAIKRRGMKKKGGKVFSFFIKLKKIDLII